MPNDATIPCFIDLPELSRRTTLRKTAIYELIKRGELRIIKLGRKTVFVEAEVNAWIEARMGEAPTQ